MSTVITSAGDSKHSNLVDSSWSKRRQVITTTGQNGDKKAKSKMTQVKTACQNGDKHNYESVWTSMP